MHILPAATHIEASLLHWSIVLHLHSFLTSRAAQLSLVACPLIAPLIPPLVVTRPVLSSHCPPTWSLIASLTARPVRSTPTSVTSENTSFKRPWSLAPSSNSAMTPGTSLHPPRIGTPSSWVPLLLLSSALLVPSGPPCYCCPPHPRCPPHLQFCNDSRCTLFYARVV